MTQEQQSGIAKKTLFRIAEAWAEKKVGDGNFILVGRKGPPWGDQETTEVTTTYIPGSRGGTVDHRSRLFKVSDGKEIVLPEDDNS